MSHPIHIVWFRQDLRVQDNPALAAAVERGGAILPVYIHAPDEEGKWAPGGAARWWQHQALASLRDELAQHGHHLVIRRGPSLSMLQDLVQSSGADAVFWNRRWEPAIIERDAEIKAALREEGLDVRSFNGSLLFEPGTLLKADGNPFRVFTPFWKNLRKQPVAGPVAVEPGRADTLAGINSLDIDELGLTPQLNWADGFVDHWSPTLKGAHARLDQFTDHIIPRYADRRDFPADDATSRLSPYLHHGQLSPRQVWQAVHQAGAADGKPGFKFLSEVVWREFAYHLMFHFPHTPERALNASYERFPWVPDPVQLEAWQHGKTGYPIVDAGMRQLWATGWMHNRVRMVVGSLLVKHLLQPWQQGASWFWDTLVDADLASNTMGWQWVAGSGADAAPYFRIFNPMIQGAKFDPEGDYVRRWVPELARLPSQVIHEPWKASALVLQESGVKLGVNYPMPIIDHGVGRQRALDALAANKLANA